MPTENRSSNTDPRDVFIRLNPLGLGDAELRKDSTGFEDQRTHSDYLLFLAGYRETHAEPQANPEPIAWMVDTAFWWIKEEAERDAAATGLPIVGLGPMLCAAPAEQHQGKPAAWRGLNELGEVVTEWIDGVPPASMVDLCGNPASFASIERAYTHADPGEAEDLLASTSLEFGERLDAVEKERDTLRAQLAEQSGLLKQADEFMYIMTGHDSHARLAHKYGEKWWDAIDKLRGKVCTALSASAEPSAPVEIDERQEFESAWSARIERLRIRERGNEFYRVQPNDLYRWNNVQDAWELWQARAALERKPS